MTADEPQPTARLFDGWHHDVVDAALDVDLHAGPLPWPLPWRLPTAEAERSARADFAAAVSPLVVHTYDEDADVGGEVAVRLVGADHTEPADPFRTVEGPDWPPGATPPGYAVHSQVVDGVAEAVDDLSHVHGPEVLARHVAWPGSPDWAAAAARWTRAVARAVARIVDEGGLPVGASGLAPPVNDAATVRSAVHVATGRHAPRGWTTGPDGYDADAVIDAPATLLLARCHPHARTVAALATADGPRLLAELAAGGADPHHVVAAALDPDDPAGTLEALAAIAGAPSR